MIHLLWFLVVLNIILVRGNAFLSPTPSGRTFPTAAIGQIFEKRHDGRRQRVSLETMKSELLQGEGMPSSVGWTNGMLNSLTQWADAKTPNRPIICEYRPEGWWLWLKWNGTILKSNWRSVLGSMCVGLALHAYVRLGRGLQWPWYSVPPPTPLMEGLTGLRKAWEFHLTIATFVLTFFTSQSFGYWKTVYATTRKIQGRINDFCMLLVLATQRTGNNENGTDLVNGSTDKFQNINEGVKHNTQQPKGYTQKGRDILHTITRLIRMSHIFFWASTPTASNGLSDSERFIADAAICPLPMNEEHIGPVLLSPYGLKALVKTGQLTKEEAQALNNAMLPPSQYAYILLTWVGLHTMKGIKEGYIEGSDGLEQNLLQQITRLRASMFDIDDFRAGRMPLAYVQLVQVLVDSLVGLSPFALYPELGVVSVPLVGLLTLFFRGLMTLSKSFLDPFGVEGYEEQNIRVDVLISEINFGAAQRWVQAGSTLPNT